MSLPTYIVVRNGQSQRNTEDRDDALSHASSEAGAASGQRVGVYQLVSEFTSRTTVTVSGVEVKSAPPKPKTSTIDTRRALIAILSLVFIAFFLWEHVR